MKTKKEVKRRYRKYDAAFKSEAMNQMKNGRGVRELASSLGVGEALLYRWKSEGNKQSGGQSIEVKKLKRELARLKEDNEILKKALSIFSQSG